MADQLDIVADDRVGTDVAEGTDASASTNLGAGLDNRRRMNVRLNCHAFLELTAVR